MMENVKRNYMTFGIVAVLFLVFIAETLIGGL